MGGVVADIVAEDTTVAGIVTSPYILLPGVIDGMVVGVTKRTVDSPCRSKSRIVMTPIEVKIRVASRIVTARRKLRWGRVILSTSGWIKLSSIKAIPRTNSSGELGTKISILL